MKKLLMLVMVAIELFGQPMQPLVVIIKTPYDKYLCGVDFTPDIGTDTFTLVSVTSENAATKLNSTSTIISQSPAPAIVSMTDQVVFMVQNGQPGETHNISVRVLDTTTMARYEGQMTLKIAQWP